MDRLKLLEEKVRRLYEERRESRAEWADWMYANHVFLVAHKAEVVADRFGAQKELAAAAGMLHDIADAVIKREDPSHEEESVKIAKDFLKDSGFSSEEIEIIVDDAMKLHGCYEGNAPQSLEGKVMATADGIVHLTSDFYDYAVKVLKEVESIEEIRKWALPKIERDFRNKILFEEMREEVRADYERRKAFFSNEF